jgi:hypothetical protein
MRLSTFTTITLALCMGVLLTACAYTAPQLVGGDKDAHGCIGSAGYSWCEIKQQCLRPWETPCEAETPADSDSTPSGSDASTSGTDTASCTCPAGYRQEGEACNPECYYSTPKCLMPSIMCQKAQPSGTAGADATVPDASAPEPQLVGNDLDEHGCKGSAGYSWCEAKRMCLRPWEEYCPDDGSPTP